MAKAPLSGYACVMNEMMALIVSVTDPAAVKNWLVTHVDDGRGHCKVCTVGAQHGYRTWPCVFYKVAAQVENARSISPGGCVRNDIV
ncbi:MAG: hypothetical protein ACRDQ0_18690 [Pseudonocardia sp.]